MNPMTWFLYTDKRAPRAYKLPYTKEVHEQLEELTKNKQEKGSEGYIEKGDKEEGSPEEQGNRTSPLQIIVVDPSSLIPKVRGWLVKKSMTNAFKCVKILNNIVGKRLYGKG